MLTYVLCNVHGRFYQQINEFHIQQSVIHQLLVDTYLLFQVPSMAQDTPQSFIIERILVKYLCNRWKCLNDQKCSVIIMFTGLLLASKVAFGTSDSQFSMCWNELPSPNRILCSTFALCTCSWIVPKKKIPEHSKTLSGPIASHLNLEMSKISRRIWLPGALRILDQWVGSFQSINRTLPIRTLITQQPSNALILFPKPVLSTCTKIRSC